MKKRRIMSAMLAFLLVFTNVKSTYALTIDENNDIKGNSILIGNYLFELDSNARSFNLNNFMSAVRSIDGNVGNTVYFKNASGEWFEIVADANMDSEIDLTAITNTITVKNGTTLNTDPTVLTSTDLTVSPATIVESQSNPGTFDTEVKVTINSKNNAVFANNIDGNIDALASASLVKTAPTGTSASIKRVDDKNITFTLTGVASEHAASINTTAGSKDNQKDYNNNGIFGDIKFLMLSDFFTGVTSVKEGGQYVVADVDFTDSEAVDNSVINDSKSQMLTIENVDYGVLVLNQGNMDDYNFTLNDVALTPTKVNDQGTVVKFEMNRKEIAVVKAVKKSDANVNDSITIGNGTNSFTTVIKDQDPDRILLSGPVSYFDYYLVDYDANGVVRSELEKTTFDTENEGVTPVDPTVPALTLVKERTPLGENIVLKVENASSELSKLWLANVYDVLKDYDTSANTRVPVQFRVNNDEGTLTILANSTAIDDRNGKHKVVIKSNGYNDVPVNFEIVEPAGDIFLSPNFNWWANDELLFELQEFNYAVTNPIQEVYLDGKLLKGDHVDYHVVSSLIRLENEALAKLTVGEHTITVKAEGFEDYTKTFTLEKAPNGAKNPVYGSDEKSDTDAQASLEVDAVSAATGVGISPGGGSDGSSGGGAIRANVIFDFDHIANAFILKGINMNTTYSDNVISWWKSLTKDAIIKDGSDVLVEYVYYKNKVGVNGDYTTFKELFATMPNENPEPSDYMNPNYEKPAGLYLNRPYSVKNMLHDGQLGDVYAFGEVTAEPAPSLSVENGSVLFGSDVVVSYVGDDKWAEALQSVKVNSNFLKFELDKDNNKIVFKNANNSFVTGNNDFVFRAEGFTTSTLLVNIAKATPQNIEATMDDAGNIIVGNFSSDLMDSLRTVYLDGKGLFTDDQVGGNNGSYHVVGNQLVLRSKIFGSDEGLYANDTQHTLKVVASGYNVYNISFTPDELRKDEVTPESVPSYVALDSDNNTNRTNSPLVIDVATMSDSDYRDAITAVEVDGSNIETSKYTMGNTTLTIDGSIFATEKSYTVKLIADNFKTKEFTVVISDSAWAVPGYVSFDKDGASVEKGTSLSINFDDSEIGRSDYAKAVTSVVVNSTEYPVSSAVDAFDITDKVNTGANTIVVKADGYIDASYTVTVTEANTPAKLVANGDYSDSTSVTLNSPSDIVISLGSYTNDVYKDSISAVKVDGVALESSKYSFGETGVDFGTDNVLTLPASTFAYGTTYTVIIEANGYSAASFQVIVKPESAGEAVPSDVKLIKNDSLIEGSTLNVTSQPSQVKIAVGDGWATAYEDALEGDNGKIVVNGSDVLTDSDTATRETISGSYTQVVTVDTSSVTEANFTILLKADGYEDKEFTVNVDADAVENVPSVVALDNSTVEKGNNVSLTVNDYYDNGKAYKNAITKVVIANNDGNQEKTSADLSIGTYTRQITLNSAWLALGTNTITIKAEGFKDFTATLEVTKSNHPDTVGFFDGDDDILDSKSMTLKNSEAVTIILGDFDGSQEDYVNAISSVEVNGSAISDYTSADTYSISWSNHRGYTIPASYFTAGSTSTVTIKANGYQDAEFTVEVLAAGAKLPVPSEVVTKSGSLTLTEEYKEAITSVKLDGVTLDSVPYATFFDVAIDFYKLSTSNGGSYAPGTYSVTIEADGYEDYTGSITF